MNAPISPEGLESLDTSAILLSPDLDRWEALDLLKPFGFRNVAQADSNLQLMAGDPHSRKLLAKILNELLLAVAQTADPDQALNDWDRYLKIGVNRTQLFSYLENAPRMLHLLCTIFGNSPAMTQTLIRDPMLIYWMGDGRVVNQPPSRRALRHALQESLGAVNTYEVMLNALRRFHRRELLRIGVHDLLRVTQVSETVATISDLACVVIQSAYEIVNARLARQFGTPMHRDRSGKMVETGFVVIGMGKFGGWELNYSSDVDLIYVYASSDGKTQSARRETSVSNEVYFEALARDLTRELGAATPEGILYRVDLRLRPDGSVGPIASSLNDAVQYYQTRGRDWERLAFLKAKPVAGSMKLGRSFLDRLRSFVGGKGEQSNARVLETVRYLKRKIQTKMIRRGELNRNVKLGTGGIRDIEFLVQTFQLLNGRKYPSLLEQNTLIVLDRLAQEKIIPSSTAKELSRAYVFLRDVEHKLQMVHELQTHLLPVEDEELAKCAVRLGYPQSSMESNAATFLRDYRKVTSYVQKEFEDQFSRLEKSSPRG